MLRCPSAAIEHLQGSMGWYGLVWHSSQGRACPIGLQSMWTLGFTIGKLVLKTLCQGRLESTLANQIKVQLFSQFSIKLTHWGAVTCYGTRFCCHKSCVNCLVKQFKSSPYLICSSFQSLKLGLTCLCLPRMFIYCFPDCTLCFKET